MKITVVGTGYVGLVSAACFAELGHHVVGVDIDAEKIKRLKKGECPIYEPGLEEILQNGLENGRLSFTTELGEALPETSIVFSAVPTPPDEDHSADLRAVYAVCDAVAKDITHDIVFVNKSTVPVGTGKDCEERMQKILDERGVEIDIAVISNPEFLREGSAVQDTLHPDRIVVGINGHDKAREHMEELYKPLTQVGKPLIFMDRESSEVVKYASNAFLANKISFINMLSALCEQEGGNIREVAKGMGLDERIGAQFLQAGIGFGGSCFPKDVIALRALSKETGVPMPIIDAVDEVNKEQRKRFFKRIVNLLPQKATVALWGLSFKPKTDDMREAPSLDLIPLLLEAGCTVRAYDPEAMENAKKLQPEVEYVGSPLEAAKDADITVLLTEWDVFRGADLKELKEAMRGTDLFDGRNIYDPEEVKEVGLRYHGIGMHGYL